VRKLSYFRADATREVCRCLETAYARRYYEIISWVHTSLISSWSQRAFLLRQSPHSVFELRWLKLEIIYLSTWTKLQTTMYVSTKSNTN
jgi:hypothetical protein